MTSRLTDEQLDYLDRLDVPPGTSFALYGRTFKALLAAARNEAVLREALEAWRAAYEGQDIGDIALRDGRATAARVRMTRKALGIES